MDNYGKTTVSFCIIIYLIAKYAYFKFNCQLSTVNCQLDCDSERIRTAIVRTGILNSIH